MTDHGNKKSIESRLERAWRRERRYFGLRALGVFILCTALLLAADFVVDWRAHLSAAGRFWLLGINAVILLGLLYWAWWRFMKPFDMLRVALQAERLYPRLRSLLVSYVQLKAGVQAEGVSPALVQAMRAQAVAQAQPLDFGKIVRYRTLRALAAAALLTLAGAVGLGLWQPEYWRVFLLRMAFPPVRISYPTRTQIEPVTRDLVIQQGRTVTLKALVGGVIPKEGQLTIHPENGNRETVTVPIGAAVKRGMRDLSFRVEAASRSFSYSFRAGDGVSEDCTVTIVPPPLVQPRVEVEFPAYTRRVMKAIETLSFEVLEGSKITWRMKSDRALTAAALLPEGGQPVPMSLSPDGREAVAALPADKSFAYAFRWEDRVHRFVYTPAVRYAVNVVADVPPQVVLVSPARDETATIRKTLDIAFDAKDDYGVTGVQIVYTIQTAAGPAEGAVENKIPFLALTNAAPEVRESYRWDVKGSIPDLKEGDVVVYALEAGDNRTPAANTARSASRRLNVVSTEEYVRLTLEKKRELLSRIKTLHTEEGQAVDAVRKLEQEGAPPAKKR